MNKRKLCVLFIILICSFLLVWFSGILPKQVARIVADIHISNFEGDYEFQSIEYSSFHDSYFIAYSLKGNIDNEIVMDIPYKYFPFIVLSDDLKERMD